MNGSKQQVPPRSFGWRRSIGTNACERRFTRAHPGAFLARNLAMSSVGLLRSMPEWTISHHWRNSPLDSNQPDSRLPVDHAARAVSLSGLGDGGFSQPRPPGAKVCHDQSRSSPGPIWRFQESVAKARLSLGWLSMKTPAIFHGKPWISSELPCLT